MWGAGQYNIVSGEMMTIYGKKEKTYLRKPTPAYGLHRKMCKHNKIDHERDTRRRPPRAESKLAFFDEGERKQQ